MNDLTVDQFSDFFEAVHGYQPFAWQERLAHEIMNETCWPGTLDIPTGCGKTSVLDMAIFQLALNPEVAARRICFVVDRRLVVDDVTDHARRLRTALLNDDAPPVVKAVAERLRALAPDGGPPLRLVKLRGGIYRDNGWAADPLTPTILVSTVDQIGSRLLFRGYGVSNRSRPIHAGLLAFDTRIILDEAHLSTVFADTLDRIRHYQKTFAEDTPLPEKRLLNVTRMSATPGDDATPFALSEKEREDKSLKPRLDARKLAELTQCSVTNITKKLRDENPRKAREQETDNRQKLIERLVECARRHASTGDEHAGTGDETAPRVIGVVVNRVATARQVFDALVQDKEAEALLLTGRIRPFDRDRLLADWLPRIRAGRKEEPSAPLFVVATQTVEVGANLDFDALITEAAPLDALRQRFGRLDRLGRRHQRGAPSPAQIVIRSDHAKNSAEDPIYGAAIAETWKWLNEKGICVTEGRGRNAQKSVDFGINALGAKLPTDANSMGKLLSPRPETPLLFPAHLDAWVQTNPRPRPDPDVAPFLHGGNDRPADVQIVWRADFDPKASEHWPDIVTLMPPRTPEALPIPLYAVRAWLAKQHATVDIADVEGARSENPRTTSNQRVLRWRGKDDTEIIKTNNIRPGDTIIVPAAYGGADRFGWNPDTEEPVQDIADQCLAQLVASYPVDAFRRPLLRIRLHPALQRGGDETEDHLRQALAAAKTEGGDAWPATKRLLSALETEDSCLDASIKAFLEDGGAQLRIRPYPDGSGLILDAPLIPVACAGSPIDEDATEDPEGDEPSFTGREITLPGHLQRVADTARDFAQRCGLDETLINTVEKADLWHDEGKRDPRFQALLHGSEFRALAAREPLAKSGHDDQSEDGPRFGYPRGARHEFTSVRLFEASGEDDALTRYLIGTHHGFGRPFVPVAADETPVTITKPWNGEVLQVTSNHGLHRLDSGWTDLFWSLIRRYGWWGLAYLEALLVTADRTVSAQERQEKTEAKEEAAA